MFIYLFIHYSDGLLILILWSCFFLLVTVCLFVHLFFLCLFIYASIRLLPILKLLYSVLPHIRREIPSAFIKFNSLFFSNPALSAKFAVLFLLFCAAWPLSFSAVLRHWLFLFHFATLCFCVCSFAVPFGLFWVYVTFSLSVVFSCSLFIVHFVTCFFVVSVVLLCLALM